MYTKYGIQDCDFYNFDEIDFIIKVIYNNIIVTRIDRFGRGKQF